jgi:DNA polymerase V
MIALVDCNNFFVSAERVFDPSLKHKSVAVLSSNDGCIIARSNDIKPVIPMGVPVFKVGEALKHHEVVLKSSNFALYSDMSRRVMATLARFTPQLDAYSIDEAFLEWSGTYTPGAVRQTVHRDTGIPISIGVASTRTLAKAATELAKHGNNALDLTAMDEADVDQYLLRLPVGEVWGVGSKLAPFFRDRRIFTAYDLKTIPEGMRRQYPITVRRVISELRGQPTDHHAPLHPKSMISTRSFGQPVYDQSAISAALCSHGAHLGIKLRRAQLTASSIEAFMSTGNKEGRSATACTLSMPTSDTRKLIQAIKIMVSRLYTPGLSYKKAGVMVYRLSPVQQLTLDSNEAGTCQAEKINTAVDAINQKWGARAIRFADEVESKDGNISATPKQTFRSPRYTTVWEELKKVT